MSIYNCYNYDFEIKSVYGSKFIEFGKKNGYDFDASYLDWDLMCRSNSMNTMRFLNQNKLWVNIFAIMNNKSDAAWC